VARACAGVYGRRLGGRSIAHTAQERGCDDVQPAVIPCGDWDTQGRVLKTKGKCKQAEKVCSYELRARRMPHRRSGSVNWEKGHQGGGDTEASQKSAATNRIRSGK
jgi:hypothetical protein